MLTFVKCNFVNLAIILGKNTLLKYEDLEKRIRIMSRSIMSARKVLLKNRANQLEFQIMNLEEAQNTATNKMDNYQRAMQHEDNKASLWDMTCKALPSFCVLQNMYKYILS